MHKIINALLSLSLVPLLSFCQSKPIEGKSINPKFEKRINRLIKHSIPTLTVMELAKSNDQYLLLDARELEEYRISHIPGAKHIGYNDFDIKSMKGIDKNKNGISCENTTICRKSRTTNISGQRETQCRCGYKKTDN